VVCCALLGPAFHVGLLLAPLLCLGLFGRVLADPAVRLFLVLAVALALADLPTLTHDRAVLSWSASGDDRRARTGSLITAILMLASFWTGLVARALAGTRELGALQTSGAVLMLGGVVLRAAAVLSLGSAFITEWRSAPGQPLVDRHLYGCIRHPSETGNLCLVLGAGL
jgi:protein-S-isoprenylcysteine O-methyltransferase Ste14